jgi:UV DNA damage endonuclease
VRAIRDLVYQAEVAEWVGADVINIHAGGVYNDRQAALARVRRAIEHELPDRVRTRLTLENDDRSYTPSDLLPLCRATGVPLVYDVHHHRCLPDGLSEEDATHKALGTWNREPLVHLSSPKQGWGGADPKPHHDLIDPRDFPVCWQDLNLTVEVEAKAKERAVAALRQDLAARGTSLWTAVG